MLQGKANLPRPSKWVDKRGFNTTHYDGYPWISMFIKLLGGPKHANSTEHGKYVQIVKCRGITLNVNCKYLRDSSADM